MKIKIECWWDKTNNINNRFIRQFVSDEDKLKYNFVNENPDITIVFGKTEWDKIETKPKNTFYLSQEPLWSKNENREIVHEYCDHIFVNDKTIYPNDNRYIETTVPMLYGASGEQHQELNYTWDIRLKDYHFDKNKNISVVCSKGYHHLGEVEYKGVYKINNTYRTNLTTKLSENKNIDIFGKRWEENGKNIKGNIWNKHIGLNDYRFSVALENSVQKNYISEKFWDVVLTNGVPVYHGCSNINNYIDDDYFIYLNPLSEDDRIEVINELSINGDKIYETYRKKIKELKNEFFYGDTFNIWNKLKNYI